MSDVSAKGSVARQLEWAVGVFAGGFSFTRSFTHPCVAQRVGPAWVLRDAPRKHGEYRGEEWVAWGVRPQELDRLVREHAHGRFTVCAIQDLQESGEALREQFKALGYRLRGTEPLMVHDLERIPRLKGPATVQRVSTPELAQRYAQASGSRPLPAEHLSKDARLRQYVALVDDQVVGWVRSIVVGEATWCASMYVNPAFRRRGIARAMLGRMLREDRASGSKGAVLLASHSGAKLYPVVGYRQIGTLLLLSPKKP